MSKYFRSSDLAHEIASAVFRVAALMRHERLRKELEGAAVELIKETCSSALDRLERLVRFTEAAGEMSEINSQVLQRELGNLQKMLNTEISVSTSRTVHSIDLDQFFVERAQKAGERGELEIENQDDRQTAILGYIRKFPYGCRMRQLSAAFANFSERTVRADIQRLMDRGLVEKVGSKTGPFSYFRAVDSTGSPQVDSAHPADSTDSLQAGSGQAGSHLGGEAGVTKEEPFSL